MELMVSFKAIPLYPRRIYFGKN